ncbi:MAG: FAD-binding oxidoreductase [Rhodospirillales bacterium]|nr:MAG: FAD-binding oxidoreductase [Rhodospirillales bacterium]
MAQTLAQPKTNTDFSPLTRYDALARDISDVFPASRIIRDPLRRLAYGTDASFYRLVPEVVAVAESEAEVCALLAACRRFGTPVTFRAAGTSLSGQAVTDSVLCLLGDGWDGIHIAPDAGTVRLQPGVIGADANRRLAPLGRKIGPDPASINACKIGGIAANNASGMCCGTAQNSYNTVAAMRLVLADGTVLDTGSEASCSAFQASHGDLLTRLTGLAAATRSDSELAGRIRRKFAIKNTTGYSLNALIDFTDPFRIMEHLMIGSEGTLGFISEITYTTVPEYADKASALALFPSVVHACEAVIRLKQTPVDAVELMDRASIRSVEDKPGMPPFIRGLPEGATALLIETRAEDPAALAGRIAVITAALADLPQLFPVAFTTDPAVFNSYWNIRKGLFPSVGALRATGTTVIIEDVAFPIEHLAAATATLQQLFEHYGYAEAIIFGHALEGNLHFVITPDFSRQSEVERYAEFMDAIAGVVTDRYDGSLKAEHGTGRNMAPFVEREWGGQAYQLMRDIKALFDPDGLLNPGVILNDDPKIHLKNLKPLPAADPLVDTCMECGFCERMCPSQGLTLTPRQRIVGWREISRLQAAGEDARHRELVDAYAYQGLDTCAACGLCATACPVGLETGLLTKKLRGEGRGRTAKRIAGVAADHLGLVAGATRSALRLTDLAARVMGAETLEDISRRVRKLSGERAPAWSRVMPTATTFKPAAAGAANGHDDADALAPEVVYLPSCVSRTMGPPRDEPEREPLPTKMEALLRKAGFRVRYPKKLNNLCCGQSFESKGLPEAADAKIAEMTAALEEASRHGALPIVSDTSPCSYRLKNNLPEHLRPLDVVEFIHDRMMDRLTFTRRPEAIALHITCSGRKMGLDGKLQAIGQACADTAVIPESVGCCGWAGDKGWTTPELNEHALRTLKDELPEGCSAGYSHSRTCEIGLSLHGQIPYRSIVYLVDRCTTGRPPPV